MKRIVSLLLLIPGLVLAVNDPRGSWKRQRDKAHNHHQTKQDKGQKKQQSSRWHWGRKKQTTAAFPQLDESRKDLMMRHRQEMKELKTRHTHEMNTMKKDHAEAMKAGVDKHHKQEMRKEHAGEMGDMKKHHGQERSELKEQHKHERAQHQAAK